MSSLICDVGLCTFTRIDTNASAIVPPDYYANLPDLGLRRKLEDATPPPITDDFIIYVPEVDTSIAPWFLPENQDELSPTVALTRDFYGSIFNALAPYDMYNNPYGTEWALLPDGLTIEEARCKLKFCGWQECYVQYNDLTEVIGKRGVVHVLKEDLYYGFVLTKWSPDIGGFSGFGRGGGFQYIRDEVPINGADLGECPICDMAKASPSQLLGPIDNQFVNVTIEGVSDCTSVIIKGVTQDSSLACNLRPTNATAPEGFGRALPNAMINGDTVSLRRFRPAGAISRFSYTVYFDAINDAGTCSGSVQVCVPPAGFTCDELENVYGYDASASLYCNYDGYYY